MAKSKSEQNTSKNLAPTEYGSNSTHCKSQTDTIVLKTNKQTNKLMRIKTETTLHTKPEKSFKKKPENDHDQWELNKGSTESSQYAKPLGYWHGSYGTPTRKREQMGRIWEHQTTKPSTSSITFCTKETRFNSKTHNNQQKKETLWHQMKHELICRSSL